MRNRVMHMQQVETRGRCDFADFGSERERVRRKFKERIVEHLDLVKLNPLVEFTDARRQGVADEVNRVAALGQLASQFRANNAAAAISRKASDADVHKAVGSRQ